MLGQLAGVRVTSLYAPEYNPRVRAVFLALRQAMGCNWLCRDDSARPLLKELAAGNCVGFAADTRFDQGGDRSVSGKVLGAEQVTDIPQRTIAAIDDQ